MLATDDFQYIMRVLNTNIDGRQKVMFALTAIKGIGRRFSNVICKKADIDMSKRYVRSAQLLVIIIICVNYNISAGELTNAEIDRLVTVIQNPRQFKVRRIHFAANAELDRESADSRLVPQQAEGHQGW